MQDIGGDGTVHRLLLGKVIAMKCYFDGSQGLDDSGAEWLTLAGYMASDVLWSKFDDAWIKILCERYPIAPYIHMSELMGTDDPFETANGWTFEKKNALILDAVSFLSQINKTAYCSFVCRIDLAAHNRLLKEGFTLKRPAVMCADACISQSFGWYYKNHKLELAHIFFDRGERFMTEFKAEWKKMCPNRHAITVEHFWGMISNVTDLDMRSSPALQAADMLAWAETRGLSAAEKPYKHLSTIFQQCVPSVRIVINEETLRTRFGKRTQQS